MARTRRIQAAEARRDAIMAELGTLDDAVLERNSDLTDEERPGYEALETELTDVTTNLQRMMEREQAVERSRALAAELGTLPPAGGRADPEAGAIYRSNYEGPHDPLMDVWRAQTQNDPDAQDRIRRHNERMIERVSILRASDRGDFGGLIIPEYATDDFAEVAREMRSFLNSLTSRPLTRSPVVVPIGNVGASAGTPAAENTAYVTADISSTPLTLTARTVAGVAEVSVEAVEFGTLETPILFGDMISAYQEHFDYQAFHGTGNNNTHLGVFNTPDGNFVHGGSVDDFRATYEAVLRAAAEIRSVDKRTPTHVCMSSLRWYSLMASTDDQGRPLMAMPSSFPSNVGGGAESRVFAGLSVVVDDNIIPTGGGDENILVYRASEAVLREQNGGNPATIRVDQAKAAQGTVIFVARGFSIFSMGRRPKSFCIIGDVPEPTFGVEGLS